MDIYDKLLEIVKTEDDLEEFLTHESEYEYLYHLSRIRQNILEWYDFASDASLLEFGAECGALTGLFCRRVKNVVAVEDDEKKREINRARNEEFNNLDIINTEDLSKYNSFDYVTIIGNYSVEKLNKANTLLKTDGTLILAIENKYGMKYWSGEERPETFSREQLIDILKNEGFEVKDIYYPIPDYVLPTEIYSSNNLPKVGSISFNTPSYEKEKITAFDEPQAFDMVIRDKKFEDFANSFLVFANKE